MVCEDYFVNSLKKITKRLKLSHDVAGVILGFDLLFHDYYLLSRSDIYGSWIFSSRTIHVLRGFDK